MRYIYGVDLEKEAKRKKKRELEQQAKEREYDALMEMHKRDMAMYERREVIKREERRLEEEKMDMWRQQGKELFIHPTVKTYGALKRTFKGMGGIFGGARA